MGQKDYFVHIRRTEVAQPSGKADVRVPLATSRPSHSSVASPSASQKVESVIRDIPAVGQIADRTVIERHEEVARPPQPTG